MSGFYTDFKSIIILAYSVLVLFCYWRLFTKLGIDGWKSLVPFYNLYLLSDTAVGVGWLFVLSFIPFVGIVYNLVMWYRLCLRFNKGIIFALGMVFLSFIFLPILALGDSKYNK